MMKDKILKEQKMITCFLPKGQGKKLLHLLSNKGTTRANLAFARGFDIMDIPQKNGLPRYEEKEVLTVVTSEEKSEEIFNLLFSEGELNHLGGGLMFMETLSMSTALVLPDIDQQDKASSEPQNDRKSTVTAASL